METTKPSPPSAADLSAFAMIDVGGKPETRRRAVAQGKIFLARDAFNAVRDGTNPKGNVLALAEFAGIMAAKRTADAIPLCHPLPLQAVRLGFSLHEADAAITVSCEALTFARTGVEMEALSGVNGALLTIYDLSKAVNPAITLGEIRLNLKEGGKSGTWTHPNYTTPIESSAPPALAGLRAAVITISDRVSAGQSQDRSGPAIGEWLSARGAILAETQVVADDKKQIQHAVRQAVQENGAKLIVTTGGTGLSPRDLTPEALTEIADRLIPGIGECLRKSGASHIDSAWLSRSLGAQIGPALVIALPGSAKAVIEGLDAVQPFLSHALHTLRGGNHD